MPSSSRRTFAALSVRSCRGAVLALVLSAALSGCISLAGKVPDTMLRLTSDRSAPAGPLADGQVSGALVVLDPTTDRSLDVLRVPVRVSGSSLAYLKNAVWVERPARLFRGVLAETLRSETGRLVTEGPEFQTQAAQVLDGQLLDMGYEAQGQAAVVRFDAFLRGRDGTVRSRRFEARITGVAPDALAVAPALNRAANDVAGQVAQWVKSQAVQ